MTAALPGSAFGELFARLKETIDLHELAGRLGLERQGGRGNYRSPTHPDKSPSLSVFKGGRAWKDHSTGEGGSCIDLVLHCRDDIGDPTQAAMLLAGWYGVPTPAAQPNEPRREKSVPEYIADQAMKDPAPAVAYLAGRGIPEAVTQAAIRARAVGWNTYCSPKVSAGEHGHGGPAAAFIVRDLATRRIEAVDLRYADPALNGGTKTQCQGVKDGIGWAADLAALAKAHTVYLVESPINALSVTACGLSAGTAAFAIRGTGNAEKIDLAFLKDKRALIALDHADPVNERTGQRPGLVAAWALYDRLTASDISAALVDMQDWEEGEDINDVLKKHGADELTRRLKQFDPWLIPGMPGGGERMHGTRRIFLPGHDFKVYWRYRADADFMHYVEEFKDNDDGDRHETLGDLCSFRLAGLSRLRVQGHLATIDGTPDTQPETVFGVSAQMPRHGNELQRRVADDQKLFNLEWWKANFGAIYKPKEFQRMLNILERAAGLGARDVVNFVGLAWRDQRLSALEGSDTHFTDPPKQCLYHNILFPRGDASTARQVIDAYQATFSGNAAMIALVWALGAHLKAVLGFYPHLQMQAEKGAGKSKLLASLQSSIAFQVLSGQMLKTDHRRRASVSYTSHPVGWDEYSKLPKTVLSEIDGLLQSTYRFEFTRTGAQLMPYLMCAPVLLAGEEVDVMSLQSKICRTTLTTAKQGPVIPRGLPQFPVWQWIQFLAAKHPDTIRAAYGTRLSDCNDNSRSEDTDATARRMHENYAAVLTAWDLLCEFAGIDTYQGDFFGDLIGEMNAHIAETDGTRLPWVWIMEIILSEIDANRFEYPLKWECVHDANGVAHQALLVRPSNIMDHVSTASHLRDKFNALPIKTSAVFARQLRQNGAVVAEGIERTIRGSRVSHMSAISLKQLERRGLYASPRID